MQINPIHIRDAIRVFQPSLQDNITGVFNIAGNEIISIRDLAELIAQYVGKAPKFVHEKSNISGDIVGDNSRMKTVLGVTPEVALKSGISEVVLLSGDNNI
jgi:nucleoside-diphosphate-sugar epimerase